MVTKTLVERIRDAVPGKNTLMKLSELSDLGLTDVIVIRPGEPFSVFSSALDHGIEELAKGEFNYLYIDTNWVETYTLGDPSVNETFKEAVEDASKRHLCFFEEMPSSDLPKDEYRKRYDGWMKEDRRLSEEYRKRVIEFLHLRPEALLERLKRANLIVAPAYLLPKLAGEGNLTNLAELVDSSEEFEFYVSAADSSYPRLLVKPNKSRERGEPDRVSRIDDETIRLLFNHTGEAAPDLLSFGGMQDIMARADIGGCGMVDERFLSILQQRQTPFQPIPRTKYVQPLSKREHIVRQIFSDDSDKEFGFEDFGVFRRKRSASGMVPSNYYGLGGKQHGNRATRNVYEADLVKRKKRDVGDLYESFWIRPLDTLQEIRERQDFLEILVQDAEQAAAFDSLESSVNGMIMPFIHLFNMANNISSNVLHSRWGSGIRKEDFHDDFLRIARMFTDAYEAYATAFNAYNPKGREIQVLKAALASPNDVDNPLARAYSFLKRLVDEQPADYNELRDMFEEELKRIGAHLIPELEHYDHTKDPEVNMSKLPKKSEGKSLDAFKSSTLQKLLEQFHMQNPVTQACHEVDYLDKVGTKLAAYSAISDFIRQHGWTKPEVVPAEEGVIDIRKGWYPLTALQHTQGFVRNDTYLSPEQRVEILDGINVGGKTIDMKKTFLIVCLALTGMYVPAEYARISMFDRVRFRLKDTGSGDRGAFVKELMDIGSALEAIGKPILLGVDETFTSTNPLEGEGMTYGLVKYLAENPTARAMFTSHYPSLHDIVDYVSGVKFAHFPFEDMNGNLRFPHNKVLGPNEIGDYAIPIARSQNLSLIITQHAEKHLEGLKR